jgi:predicted negative regulator of RcsB-dependent stress response
MSRITQMPLIALTAIRNWWVQRMSTQTTPGQSFPTPCKRCGGALYPPDDTCPWCGASHAVAYGIRQKTAGHALPPDDPDTHAPDATQSAPQHAARHPHLMLPDTPIAPLSMPVPLWKSLGKWIFTKGLVVVLLLGALLYAGYALFGDHKDSTADEPATKTATGTIVPYQPASAPSARQSVASIASSPPAPAPSPPVAHVPLPVAPAGPAPAQVVLPPLPPRGITKPRDVPEALQAAHASLQANDLTGAQAALAEVLVAQPDNADARLMQQDLLQRQTKRDHAMRNANVCAADRLWSCVRHNATDALAIDATNPNVRALLERSIREAGWNTPALPTARGGAQATAPTAPTVATANPPPPARPAKRGNANAQIPVANTPAPAPATANPNATATATANPTATAAAAAASASGTDPNSVDARIRAIVESGWSHPAPRAATPASAAPAAP